MTPLPEGYDTTDDDPAADAATPEPDVREYKVKALLAFDYVEQKYLVYWDKTEHRGMLVVDAAQ